MKFTINHINPKIFTVSQNDNTGFGGNILFSYTGDNPAIDTDYWEIVNTSTSQATFEEDRGIICNSLGEYPTANFYENYVYTKFAYTYQHGVFRMSTMQLIPVNTAAYVWYGFRNFITASGVDLYQKAGTVSLSFRIMVNNVSVYEVDGIANDIANIKIVINTSNNISLYVWNGVAWEQKGTTQTYNLGKLSAFMATRGGVKMKAAIRDIYITDSDYTNCYPVSSGLPGVIDARGYGAVADGVTNCTSSINNALLSGDVILQDGTFLISSAIKIPSTRTLYGKNAKIKLDDESYDNAFRNLNFDTGNTNINVIGLGNFVIDGNAANNNDSYATYPLSGNYPYHYVLMLLYNTTNFNISRVNVADMAHYAMILQKCSNGTVDRIYLNQYTGLVNQDGIGLRFGTHDVAISNIKGYTRDDFFSIHIGKGNSDLIVKEFYNYNVGDVYNITLDNIIIYNSILGSLYASIVGNQNKAHDIAISNVEIYNAGTIFFSSYGSGYYDSAPLAGDWDDVSISNVIVENNSRDYLYYFGEIMSDHISTGITNNSGKSLFTITKGTQTNCSINGVPIS